LVGDRLYTDISACTNTGITSILVLTGETDRTKYEASYINADIVVPSLKELEPFV